MARFSRMRTISTWKLTSRRSANWLAPGVRFREFVEEFVLRDGRKLHLLGEGCPINLAAAEGRPASVMDLSFANQALSVEFMTKNHATLDKRVYGVPEELDRQVARMKLESMGVKIDRLTLDQERYLTSWSEGT